MYRRVLRRRGQCGKQMREALRDKLATDSRISRGHQVSPSMNSVGSRAAVRAENPSRSGACCRICGSGPRRVLRAGTIRSQPQVTHGSNGYRSLCGGGKHHVDRERAERHQEGAAGTTNSRGWSSPAAASRFMAPSGGSSRAAGCFLRTMIPSPSQTAAPASRGTPHPRRRQRGSDAAAAKPAPRPAESARSTGICASGSLERSGYGSPPCRRLPLKTNSAAGSGSAAVSWRPTAALRLTTASRNTA